MTERLNPYNCNNPAPPEEFAGREGLVRQIKSYIKSSKDGNLQNFAIIGEWAVGKTSLIDFLRPYVQSTNSLIVPVEGSEGAISDIASLYERILESIRTTTLSQYRTVSKVEDSFRPTIGFGSPLPDKSPKLIQFFADEFDIDIRSAIIHGEAGTRPLPTFCNLLSKAWDHLNEIVNLVIVVIDNAEFLRKIPSVGLELRNAFQTLNRSGCKYMSILACKPIFFEGIKTIEPTARFWHKLSLPPFDRDATKEAVLKPLQHHKIMDFAFDEEAIEILFEKSKGHPYFLKLLCHYVFRIAHASKTIATRELMENIYPEVLLSLAQDKFSNDLEIATEKEQSLLLACSQLADEFTLSDIKKLISGNPNEHVRRLVSKELLIQVKRGCYSFYHPLFKEFLLLKKTGKMS